MCESLFTNLIQGLQISVPKAYHCYDYLIYDNAFLMFT